MSQRREADRQRIEQFLVTLGGRFTRAGRVYLVGGTTLVWEGLRQQTLNIDLTFDVAREDVDEFIRVIQTLKHELAINVEERGFTW